MGHDGNPADCLGVTVFGAGTMGHGLALLAAKAGYRVWMVDIEERALNGAMDLIRAQLRWLEEEGELSLGQASEALGRIQATTHWFDALEGSQLVLEAISEDVSAKRELYEEIASKLSEEAVLASNTSYLDVFSLAPREVFPRFVIAHFYAPPHLIPLVEVVGSPQTAPWAIQRLVETLRKMGQRPVLMKRFIPGYIVNRLQRAMAREIFHLLDEGYATPEQIDEAVKATLGLRIPVVGVVQRYDFTGLDLALKFLSNPSIELIKEDKVPRTLKALVEEGKLGVKSSAGFYDYGSRPTVEILLERDRRLLALRRFLQGL